MSASTNSWVANDPEQIAEAKKLEIWPLDEHNAALLNEVHPRGYVQSSEIPHEVYDLIAIGAGAGGLVSAKQSARRGAKSALISEKLAGGDCLNVGCVPSKALIRAARAVAEVRRSADFGVILSEDVRVDFAKIMEHLRTARTKISPADGHAGTTGTGAHVFQGRGRFTGPDTIQVGETVLKFKKAVVATGGRPAIPGIPGLKESPYTTNEILFNLQVLPPRMVILGAGVVALEMAQCFATFGSKVTVLQRSEPLFASKQGDAEAAHILQQELEKSGVHFLTGSITRVETLRDKTDDPLELPLLKVTVDTDADPVDLECECLLVAAGRVANVEDVGLEEAGVEYELGKGIKVNDLTQSVSNPNVYAVGDCVAGVPQLTHMSGEMAKMVVQNSLFEDDWKLSSLVVPAVMYTEPEYATVGLYSEANADKQEIEVDTYRAGLEHNDRAILEGSNVGFCKIFCRKGTDEIVGATIVAERAGEMINEISLAIKNGLGLRAIGRNIHSYPTTGEAVMGCGIQYINSHWKTLD
jgi:pyruvate/2-oxoglutarate dehydrogenase complex dihydrolipoamide dehydrogenase (E3) component